MQDNPMPAPSTIALDDRSMATDKDLDLPIALRKAKRRIEATSPEKSMHANSNLDEAETQAAHSTPSRTRTKKKVRFSAPAELTATPSSNTSGLTPFIGRTTLNTPRRRASTPNLHRTPSSEIQFMPFRDILDDRTKRRIRRRGMSEETNAYEFEKKDRNQLRRELSVKNEEIRELIESKDREAQKLKDELEALKSYGNTKVDQLAREELTSSHRVAEAELETLRQSFNGNDLPSSFDDNDMTIDWNAVKPSKGTSNAQGPSSDGGDTILIDQDSDDDIFVAPDTPSAAKTSRSVMTELVDTTSDAELLAMALDVESAKKEKRRLFKDLREYLPPSDPHALPKSGLKMSLEGSRATPQKANTQHSYDSFSSVESVPSPPKNFYSDLSKALKSTTNRAETAELALHALETDLRDLGIPVTPSDESQSSNDTSATALLTSLRAHFRGARIDLEHIMPGETCSGLNDTASVLPECISKLRVLSQQVSEREVELRTMHEQQRTLKGNFECELRAAEKANQRIKELEDAVEEGADDMLNMRMKLQATEKEVKEREYTTESLVSAMEKYQADVSRLEGLVLQLETDQSFQIQQAQDTDQTAMSDLQAKVIAEETGRRKAEESAVERLEQIKILQFNVAANRDESCRLKEEVAKLEDSQAELETVTSSQQTSKLQHEMDLQILNTRISNLGTALATSEAEVNRLEGLVSRLRDRVALNHDQGVRVVEEMWEEQVRSATRCAEQRKRFIRAGKVREANWRLEDEIEEEETLSEGREPLTPVSLVRFVDAEEEGYDGRESEGSDMGEVEGRVQIGRGRSGGRRRSSFSRTPTGLEGLAVEMNSRMGKGKGRARRQRPDSGIGMSSLIEEDEAEGQMDVDSGAGTDLSSDDINAHIMSSGSGFDIHEDGPEDLGMPSSELSLAE